jgi:hypothetical protein
MLVSVVRYFAADKLEQSTCQDQSVHAAHDKASVL